MKRQQRAPQQIRTIFEGHAGGRVGRLLGMGLLVFTLSAQAGQIARVNGTVLTDQDLESYLTASLADGSKTPGVNTPEGREQAIQAMIDQELLVNQANKEKMDQGDDYKTALAMARRQILINLLLNKQLGQKLSESATKKYFESHPELFSTDQARVVHVLVPTESEAQQILAQARKPGVDLQDIAEKSSKDPTAKQNRGDVGYFTRDNVVREFADAVFGAKKGQLVGPVQTPFGYHVIKIIDFKVGRIKNYHEAELQAKGLHREEVLRTYLSQLRDVAQVQRLGTSVAPPAAKAQSKTRAR